MKITLKFALSLMLTLAIALLAILLGINNEIIISVTLVLVVFEYSFLNDNYNFSKENLKISRNNEISYSDYSGNKSVFLLSEIKEIYFCRFESTFPDLQSGYYPEEYWEFSCFNGKTARIDENKKNIRKLKALFDNSLNKFDYESYNNAKKSNEYNRWLCWSESNKKT